MIIFLSITPNLEPHTTLPLGEKDRNHCFPYTTSSFGLSAIFQLYYLRLKPFFFDSFQWLDKGGFALHLWRKNFAPIILIIENCSQSLFCSQRQMKSQLRLWGHSPINVIQNIYLNACNILLNLLNHHCHHRQHNHLKVKLTNQQMCNIIITLLA
jgi:hypothetical protein